MIFSICLGAFMVVCVIGGSVEIGKPLDDQDDGMLFCYLFGFFVSGLSLAVIHSDAIMALTGNR